MKMSRLLCGILAPMMLTASVASAEAEFPLTQENATLSVMARVNSFYPDQNLGSVQNMQEYEKMTGVHVEWENVDPDVFNNTLAASIAADDLPDVIFKGGLNNTQLYEWGKDEILVDLTPYLEECAPNFWALMEENPTIRKAVTAPNGAIYGLPQVILAPQMRAPTKLYINQKALASTGWTELPKTTDELYDFLVAIRDGDMNGNGEADEIPLAGDLSWMYRLFYGSFGLRTRGAHHDVVDVDPETGKLRVFATSENYRKFLEYMHKLYADKLIYQEVFTDGKKSVPVFATEERLGAVVDTTLNNIPTDKMPDYKGMKLQVKGPDGYDLVSEIRSNLHSTGNFAITYQCKDVELALRWVDYFYSPEGSLFYNAGIKDVNWEEKEDGSLGYTEETNASRTDNMTQDGFIAQFAMWPGGRNPTAMMDNLWGAEYDPEPAETAEALMQYASDVIWPFFSWTDEENKVVSTVGNDIETYIKNCTAQAIAGEAEITDEWWNGFVKDIESMGADKLLATYQSAVDRIYAGEKY